MSSWVTKPLLLDSKVTSIFNLKEADTSPGVKLKRNELTNFEKNGSCNYFFFVEETKCKKYFLEKISYNLFKTRASKKPFPTPFSVPKVNLFARFPHPIEK